MHDNCLLATSDQQSNHDEVHDELSAANKQKYVYFAVVHTNV